jgi:hypothetical protein
MQEVSDIQGREDNIKVHRECTRDEEVQDKVQCEDLETKHCHKPCSFKIGAQFTARPSNN